jgi:hypothetical protein
VSLALALAVVVRTLAGCAAPSVPPRFPAGLRDIAVLPTSNQTGEPLQVQYGGVINLIVAAPRARLRARGFGVADPAAVTATVGKAPPANLEEAIAVAVRGKLAPAAVFIVLRRWEPDIGPANNFVDVAFEMWLIEAPSGDVIWTYRRPLQPVPTQGMPNVGEAYVAAARRLAGDMVAAWRPDGAGPE